MKIHVVLVAMAIAALFVGCVSVESTKAQLESGDAQSVRQAEETIVHQALYNQQISTGERIQYVKLTKNPEVLFDICDRTSDNEIKSAALRQIDFSQKGIFLRFVKKFGMDHDLLYSDESSDFINWMLNSVPTEELITAFRQLEKREISCKESLEGPLAKKLVQNVTSEEVLFELLSGDVGRRLDSSDKSAALAKLTDQSKFISLCCGYGRFSDEEKTAMLQKVSEDRVCEFIRSDKRLGEIKNEMLLSRVSDNKKLAKALIDREKDSDDAESLVEALAERSQTAVASVATLAKNAKVKEWAEERIKDKKIIMQMILSKHVDDAQKIRLADRLEYGDVDEKTYAAVTSEAVKKAVFRKLSPEGRAALRKADRRACERRGGCRPRRPGARRIRLQVAEFLAGRRAERRGVV